MKDGDALTKQQQLEQTRLVWDFFIQATALFTGDWLHWIEYIKGNLN